MNVSGSILVSAFVTLISGCVDTRELDTEEDGVHAVEQAVVALCPGKMVAYRGQNGFTLE